MRILLLSKWFPHPATNGAQIRLCNLIRQLHFENEIDLLAFARPAPVAQSDSVAMHRFCRRIEVVPPRMFNENSLSAWWGFASWKPRSVVQTYSKEMARLIDDSLKGNTYDLTLAFEAGPPSLVSLFASRIATAPVILEDVEVGVLQDAFKGANGVVRLRHGLTWYKQARFTRALLQSVAGCIVPSELERRRLLPMVPSGCTVEVVPNCVDLPDHSGDFGRRRANSLVFSGSVTYEPNLDAMQHFLSSIYPTIQAAVTDVNLDVLGKTDAASVCRLPRNASVTFTGLIPDVRARIATASVNVVPIRAGAGTRVKIIESMALGTPVVSTTKGAEGLEVTHAKDILIADEPGDFANSVIRLLRDDELRDKLILGGRELVRTRYSAEVVGRQFNSTLNRIVSRHASR